MLSHLKSLAEKRKKTAIGLMSGTSKDAVDAALVRLEGSGPDTAIELVKFISIPYESSLRKRLEALSPGSKVEEISRLNFELGELFADTVLDLINKSGVTRADIDFIGSHGQTVFHDPPSVGAPTPSTLQLGELDVIAERTGITTVGDFRTRDMAAGGEGAPLVPYLDYILFRKEGATRVAQNIGGIANSTVVTGELDGVYAFDNGPGNKLMDSVMSLESGGGVHYDENGQMASQGTVNTQLLSVLLSDPYYRKSPPKSTGEEHFGLSKATELYRYVTSGELQTEDLMATLLELTVETIVLSYEQFIFPTHDIKEVILSGGGCHNTMMMRRLAERLGSVKCSTTADYGIPVDAKEALAFAVLANELIAGNSANLPAVTGARRHVPLGKIVLGSLE